MASLGSQRVQGTVLSAQHSHWRDQCPHVPPPATGARSLPWNVSLEEAHLKANISHRGLWDPQIPLEGSDPETHRD